jgi:hypothetical protein
MLIGSRRTVLNSPWPIKVTDKGIVDAYGRRIYLHGDTPWSIVVQFSTTQIDTYLNNRASKGINCILFNAIEHNYSDQTPAYRTVEGYDPFSPMTNFAGPVTNYWNKVDYVVNACKDRGIIAMINPAYLGYLGGSEGWMTEVSAESDADLQTYGAWLANRYTQGNIIWCFGGDFAGDTTQRAKQWQIVTGIRSVRTTDIITSHNARTDSDAYSHWNGYAGFNLNAAYTSTDIVSESITCLTRTNLPYFHIEAQYKDSGTGTTAVVRVQAWQSLCMGAQGHMFGQTPLWAGGATNAGGTGAANTIANDLNEPGVLSLQYLRNFIEEFRNWHTLIPKQDATVVSTSLGSGTARVCPTISADAKFGVIHTNTGSAFTLVLSAFSGASSVRLRWYDPSNGRFTYLNTYQTTGTQSIAYPGANSAGNSDWVLVVDEDAITPSLGLHGLEYDQLDGLGTSPMTVSLGATGASGSTMVACTGGSFTDLTAPYDNKGNTYPELESAGYYGGQWPGYGVRLFADAVAVGGAGHTMSVSKDATPLDESTLIAVEIKNGGVVQDTSIVIREQAGALASLVSASVTTTGPAMLVSFFGGDGAPNRLLTANPEAGWTKIEEVAIYEVFHVQLACAVKYVPSAGTYTCTWTPDGDQGGVIAMIAVQKA